MWDAATGAVIAVLVGHTDRVNAAVFSSEGSRIVTASADNTARVWNAMTGALDVVLAGHTDRVLGAAFSRDNSRIVTASADSTARIWDAATGAALATLRGHTGAVAAAAFGPDGSRIVTASADRTARIWQLDPLVLMPADQRQSYICRERLIGARSSPRARWRSRCCAAATICANPAIALDRSASTITGSQQRALARRSGEHFQIDRVDCGRARAQAGMDAAYTSCSRRAVNSLGMSTWTRCVHGRVCTVQPGLLLAFS